MGELQAATESASPLLAILWVFYPMAIVVLIELLLRAMSGDDDDDSFGGGKCVRVGQMEPAPVTVPTGA